MISEIQGDILLTKAQAIVHGVAPNDDFHQGLALAIREKWPVMVKDFRHWCRTAHPKPGEAWLWGTTDGQRIINLLTQEPAAHDHSHPGTAKLESVNHALKALHHLIEKEGITSIALPKLATGVGRLEWSEVRSLIEKHLGSLNIPIMIYGEYHKGQQAVEPGLA